MLNNTNLEINTFVKLDIIIYILLSIYFDKMILKIANKTFKMINITYKNNLLRFFFLFIFLKALATKIVNGTYFLVLIFSIYLLTYLFYSDSKSEKII